MPEIDFPFKKRAEAYHERRGYFHDILERARESKSFVAINGYSEEQTRYLVGAVAVCTEPKLLQLSQCTHRAVVATVVMYYDNFDKRILPEIIYNHEGEFAVSESKEKSGGMYFVSCAWNNWIFVNPDVENLNCKTIAGLPYEVPRESLMHLVGDVSMNDLNDIDNACPKRTKGKKCNVAHAEATVLKTTVDLFKRMGVGPATKTCLVSTWVPCEDCFSQIAKNGEVYGTDIDVVSVYSAGDSEDLAMSQAIREQLDQGKLGHFHGPLVNTSKTLPGYGWRPALKGAVSELRKHMEENKRGLASEAQLFTAALNLLD